MLTRRLCETCAHFRAGAAPDMRKDAPVATDDEIGVCEYRPPLAVQGNIAGSMYGAQPAVHASRSCSEHVPRRDQRDPDPRGKVRHLNPVKPAA